MKSKVQKSALTEVKRLQGEITKMLRAKAFNIDYYAYSMKEVEKKLEEYLREVDKLTKEYGLDDTIPLKFKKVATEKIYDTAMKRGDYKWAASFAAKYGL